MTLTLSFALPANANDPSVVAALQREVASSAFEAITTATGGIVPSNVTVIPIISSNTDDGTITVTMRVQASFSASVISTATAIASSYLADPAGVTAAAVKAASNGAAVVAAAAGMTSAATRAASLAGAFANGTILTGSPQVSLASRLAAAASSALMAAGKGNVAALVNISSLVPSAVTEVGLASVDISNQVISGIASAYGIAASDSSSASRETLTNGITSGAAFAVATFAAIYFYVKRSAAAETTAAAHIATQRSSAELNPLFKHARPRPPTGKPPRHAYKPYN
jgi:hypothetical protein